MSGIIIVSNVVKIIAAVIATVYDAGVIVSAERFRKRLRRELEKAGRNEIVETDDGGLICSLAAGILMTAVTAFVLLKM